MLEKPTNYNHLTQAPRCLTHFIIPESPKWGILFIHTICSTRRPFSASGSSASPCISGSSSEEGRIICITRGAPYHPLSSLLQQTRTDFSWDGINVSAATPSPPQFTLTLLFCLFIGTFYRQAILLTPQFSGMYQVYTSLVFFVNCCLGYPPSWEPETLFYM